jgi:hypothetical protein
MKLCSVLLTVRSIPCTTQDTVEMRWANLPAGGTEILIGKVQNVERILQTGLLFISYEADWPNRVSAHRIFCFASP